MGGKPGEKAVVFSETWVKISIGKGEIVYALITLEKEEEEIALHPLTQSLTLEFEDVFPNNLPL